ncbi:Annexin [Neocallimastix lanati (nom. inval.)]|nr:Annexin [Neocallimastix sp. JGI-2020a]
MSNNLLTAFQVEKDVKTLRNAMKGAGTDEQVLVDILGGRTPQQMVQIINGYKKAYETTLSDTLSKELIIGNFGLLCMGLAVPILEYDLTCVHEAMNGWFGANDSVLIEVLVGRTEKDMGIIKTAYVAKYGKEIEDDVREHLSGDFRNLFLAILSEKESNDEFNYEEDVETLYQAGDGKKWGHNKDAFINILTHRTDKQLNKIFYEYENKYKKPFLSVIRNNFHGNLQNALANIAKSAMNRVQLIAELFENAVYGIDTKHTKLIRLVIRHRSPPVMKLIKEAYKNLYGITLEERISNEVEIFGMYRELLLKIIQD